MCCSAAAGHIRRFVPHPDGNSFLRASHYLSASIDLGESPRAGRCLQVRQDSNHLDAPLSCRTHGAVPVDPRSLGLVFFCFTCPAPYVLPGALRAHVE